MILTKIIDGKMWVLAEDCQAAINALRNELVALRLENYETLTEKQKNKYSRELLKESEKTPPVSGAIESVSSGMGEAIDCKDCEYSRDLAQGLLNTPESDR